MFQLVLNICCLSLFLYSPDLRTHSVTSFAPNPVAPLVSSHTGPAISMCAYGFFLSTNSVKNRAAVMAPPYGPPRFVISATLLFNSSAYSFAMGIRQDLSPVVFEISSRSLARSSSSVHTPQIFFPSETMHAPVNVDSSMMLSQPHSLSAKTNASASVSLPSASVLSTSIVLPLLAVRMSLGTIALALIMFSHAATTKWASTPGGWVSPTARAAPRTAAAPPQSNFMSSIMPVLMLYPPVSKRSPLPTIPTFFLMSPSFGL
mmetsp:Transcript_4514/g.8061  ORF Transcript_4514/g.8061 Transcript_4514/m.8061 type:complete len:261 (+) Transcript_4514:274-1056(+)